MRITLNAGCARPNVLLTGFDAFGGLAANPSGASVQHLDGETVAGHLIVGACLPTSFTQAPLELARLVYRFDPALVICVGMAGGRQGFSMERVAINIDDARIPDNLGRQPVDEPVVFGGPTAYFSTLPIKAMVRALLGAGIAAEVSQTAGTFVCNHVFYLLMHHLATHRLDGQSVRGGFIHVPGCGSEDDAPILPINETIRGLRVALECALTTPVDCVISGGSIS